MIKYFFTIVSIVLGLNTLAQEKIILIVNGKKTDQVIISENPSVVNVERSKLKRVRSVALKITGIANGAYKRSIQITDENESQIYQVNEQRSKHLFKIDLAKLRSQIAKQDVIKVFLAEDPANEMMRLPSKRRLIAEVHFK